MNLPNILSVFRLCLIPFFVLAYFNEHSLSGLFAFLVFGVASLTDVLDGWIARRYNLTSKLGRILDPLGDKLMTFTVLICITINNLIPLWALIIFVVKECMMGLGGLILYRRISDMPQSNYFGKTSTIVFFAVCVILIIFGNSIPQNIATIMISFAIAVTLVAFVSYIINFAGIFRKEKQ